jgi:quinoprotein glucose dehydrogenase
MSQSLTTSATRREQLETGREVAARWANPSMDSLHLLPAFGSHELAATRTRMFAALCAAAALFLAPAMFADSGPAGDLMGRVDWPEYLGGPDRNHYSVLTQITPQNVAQLKVAWEFHTGEPGQLQCNPIVVDGTLYAVTATNKLFALDAATGKERWRFAVTQDQTGRTMRGVTYWTDGTERRIFYTVDAFLYAIDAATGKQINAFGTDGRVSLKLGLGEQAQSKWVGSTTPGTLFGDLLIVPTRVTEQQDAAPGYIQAFNVRTGELVWVFRTIPLPGEAGSETWPADAHKNIEVGAANCWTGMAIDRERGILFVPTGSPAPDFWGGARRGQNLFANCLLALDAKTGKRLWHFQFVHHDLWDRDLPAPPNLVTLRRDGKAIPAVAQVTKSGYVFVFNRLTGEPLFPIEEVPVPKSDLPGEDAWPTQPVPKAPAPFARQTLKDDEVSPYSENRDALLAELKAARKGAFVPFSKTPTVLFPGFDGGAEWGGAAVDPSGVMYVNASELAWIASMSDALRDDQLANLSPGRRVYMLTCAPCHGAELKGNPASGFPSLVDIGARKRREEIEQQILTGKGMMPGFSALPALERQLVTAYLVGDEKQEATAVTLATKAGRSMPYVPFKFNGYRKFLDSKGYPAIAPPWGTLTAIDLNTGEQRWRITLGEFKELRAKGIPPTGAENYGGPVITAGGVLFIGATKDGMFRAFESRTGKLLWETTLPAAGFATPATYAVGGKQYVVIACGGTKLGLPKGDSYVAFALPSGGE